MPAEWEPHAATWLAWPHNCSDWPEKFAPIPWIYADIVRHLAAVERVEILVRDGAAEREARQLLHRSHALLDNIRFHHLATNRSWIRDYGPIFVQRARGLAAVKWRFNGWAKYPDWKLDERAGAAVAGLAEVPVAKPTIDGRLIVLEGGSIDVNGCGALLTTRECLLSRVQQRNPGITRRQLEQVFATYLGAARIVWLEGGIAGDDTHGHIDDTARFVSPDTVVACVESDRRDPKCAPLRKNLQLLKNAVGQDGRALNVVELPMPSRVYFNRQLLPASYANFYVANGIVLVPIFHDPNDRVALDILAAAFPSRQIIPIYCRDLVLGLGTLHCMTQQQPA